MANAEVIAFPGNYQPAPRELKKHLELFDPYFPHLTQDEAHQSWGLFAKEVRSEAWYLAEHELKLPYQVAHSIIGSELSLTLPKKDTDVGGVSVERIHASSGKPTWGLQFDEAYLFDLLRVTERAVMPGSIYDNLHVRKLNVVFLKNLFAGLIVVDTVIEQDLLKIRSNNLDRYRFAFASAHSYDHAQALHREFDPSEDIESNMTSWARELFAGALQDKEAWTAPRNGLVNPLNFNELETFKNAVRKNRLKTVVDNLA